MAAQTSQFAQNQIKNKQLEDQRQVAFKRIQFEKTFKKSKAYKAMTRQFINMVDNKGKTALHYTAFNCKFDSTKTLIQHGACLYIRDLKHRKPMEAATQSMIAKFIEKEEFKFEQRKHSSIGVANPFVK